MDFQTFKQRCTCVAAAFAYYKEHPSSTDAFYEHAEAQVIKEVKDLYAEAERILYDLADTDEVTYAVLALAVFGALKIAEHIE